MKKIIFHGTTLGDLKEFPQNVRREAGYQLNKVQMGLEPDNWKPMVNIGHGAQEIRIRDDAGQFRVIYVAKFADALHVLHAFQKKTQRTSKTDIDLAQKRYDEIKGTP